MFSRTKHGADRIARNLKKQNINAASIHGDKGQNHRQKVLREFKENKLGVLVATDIAARGIDIDGVRPRAIDRRGGDKKIWRVLAGGFVLMHDGVAKIERSFMVAEGRSPNST